MSDLRFALRSLIHSPGFAAAAILTLAIAIGANTAMFSILYAVVLQPLDFRQPERVVRVWQTDAHNSSFQEGASAPDLLDWKKQQRVFSTIVGVTRRTLNLTDRNAEAERVSMAGVSHDYFDMLGIAPVEGRSFAQADDRTGAEPVAIISEALWQKRFGRGAIAARRITLDGTSYAIVGVMPRRASLSVSPPDVWIPLTAAIGPLRDERGMHNVYALARLKDGVTVEEAQSEMGVISARLAQQYPEDNKGRGANVEPVHEALVHEAKPRLYILSAAVIAVLLIACINVAGLMLARADARARELAIRASLGASRARIIRQLLTESAMIAAGGGALGVMLAWCATRALSSFAPALPRGESIAIDLPVLLFAIVASVFSVLIFGLVPAIRVSTTQPGRLLGSARGVIRGTRTAGRGVLVIAEVALAVMLVTGSGVLLKSLANLMAVDVGLRTENVVTFSMSLPESKYPVPSRDQFPVWPAATNFYDALLERIETLPGVLRVALAVHHPLDPGFTSQVAVVGEPEKDGPRDEVRIRPVSPSYFETLDMAVVRGRALSADDRAKTAAVIVVNEALTNRYFRDRNPIGRQLVLWGTPRTIVGVVKGERFGGPQHDVEPALYPPLAQMPMSNLTLVVAGRGDANAVIGAVRATTRTVDSDVALFDVELLDQTLKSTVATPRFQAILITTFGAIALLLSAIGLYALIAYQVQRRTNEIGIRLALGATRAAVARLVLSRAAALALAGIGLGVIGALAAARSLEAIVFQVSTRDPAIYTGVPLLLVIVALVATWIPARRAIRVDPAIALQSE